MRFWFNVLELAGRLFDEADGTLDIHDEEWLAVAKLESNSADTNLLALLDAGGTLTVAMRDTRNQTAWQGEAAVRSLDPVLRTIVLVGDSLRPG